MTQSADDAARRRAVVVAGHLGDAAKIEPALADPSPTVRDAALGAASRAAILSRDQLIAACGDISPVVRRRAAEVAATRPDLPSEAWLGLLADEVDDVVETAAWACGELERVDDEVLMRLITLATDATAPLVRESAIAALGAIGDPRGLPAILHGCTDKPAIRRRAVLALAPFDGPEVDTALERARQDRDWQVRQSAEDVSVPDV